MWFHFRTGRVEWVEQTHEKLVKDLQTITKWACQWKIGFNHDITKQAIEVIFSVKKKEPEHPELLFSGTPVSREDHTKYLRVYLVYLVYLDSGLTHSKHIREAVMKATKGASLLKYQSKYVSRKVLDLPYNLDVRPHLDYGDVMYHN